MSGAAIGPGDWVEFIGPYCEVESLHVGRLYLCEEIARGGSCDHCGGPVDGLRLRGVPAGIYSDKWCANHFRPIYRPKSDFSELLKTPADPREIEHA